MNKAIFYMCCGIPGAGKSTWLEKNKEKLNFVIHSSDIIREELGDVNDQSKNELVFNILHNRIKEDLRNGKNVVMDATNLSRKRRINFVRNELRDIQCEKVCVLFATPIEICKRNNNNRDRVVPNDVIEKMIRGFEVPCKQEGWNRIQVVWWDWGSEGIKFDFHEDVEEWRNISHDSPHHTKSIGDHMIKAFLHSFKNSYNFMLDLSAYMHDCGKIYTKDFHNSKGEPCETAHYYDHHNYSAYLSLFYLKDLFEESYEMLSEEEILFVSLLINLHMRPFLAWKDSEKSKEKDRKLFGDKVIKYVEALHECDLAAH